jgi:hypothetical protein
MDSAATPGYGQPRVNSYLQPEKLLPPDDDEDDGDAA